MACLYPKRYITSAWHFNIFLFRDMAAHVVPFMRGGHRRNRLSSFIPSPYSFSSRPGPQHQLQREGSNRVRCQRQISTSSSIFHSRFPRISPRPRHLRLPCPRGPAPRLHLSRSPLARPKGNSLSKYVTSFPFLLLSGRDQTLL